MAFEIDLAKLPMLKEKSGKKPNSDSFESASLLRKKTCKWPQQEVWNNPALIETNYAPRAFSQTGKSHTLVQHYTDCSCKRSRIIV